MSTPQRATQRILLSVPHMGGNEFAYVQEAFTTNWLSTVGPHLTALEKSFADYVGRPSVALGSGTAAIHLGLKLLGVGPGDEVVCPTLTFSASCNPLLYENARPVFIDCEAGSWNIDASLLGEFLDRRAREGRLPKAVIIVHLFGRMCDMDSILEACARHRVPLLEDAAEALGAFHKGRPAGTLGEVGIFSFNGNKIITSTGGGMLVSARKEWVDQARHWSTQARDTDPLGVNNYVHSAIGYNYRMSNVLAGIARGQMEILPRRVAERRAIYYRYREALHDVPGLSFLAEPADCVITHWLSCLLVDRRKFGMSAVDLIRRLDAANVEARPVWRPMHTQPLFAGYECVGGARAESFNQRGICLPSSSSLTQMDQDFVIQAIKDASMH